MVADNIFPDRIGDPQGRRAVEFLDTFRRTSSNGGNALAAIADDPEGFAAAIAAAPDRLGEALADDVCVAPIGPVFVRGHAFASAAYDASGCFVVADPRFASWLGTTGGMHAALDRISLERPSVSFLMDGRGRCVAVATAPLAYAQQWPLSFEVRACLENGQAKIAAIARVERSTEETPNAASTCALQLTGLEARVVAALVHTGDAVQAARVAGVGYETARAVLKAAMRKAGARTQSALVSLVLRLDSGEGASSPIVDVIRDLFGLSERQSRLALAVAQGATRAEVAVQARVSSHVVKVEMAAIYDRMGVGTTAALSRAIGEIGALTALAEASSVDLMSAGQEAEPLRLLPRPGRAGRIAFADHGPTTGRPVIILHTATTGRHLPPSHVAALQSHGLRPVAVDRPGTGLTDMCEGPLLDGSANDLVDVLDALGFVRANIVARGGAMVLARFAYLYPDRLERGLALNPEPRPTEDTRFLSFFGKGKRLIFEHPALIGVFARHLAQRSASRIVETLVTKALAASPADLATLSNPAFMTAYVRATQQSALQNGAGFIAIAKTEPVACDSPLADGSAMTILFGAEDPLYAMDDAHARWSAVWPGCRVHVVPDAGRLLQYQRPDLIADVLNRPLR